MYRAFVLAIGCVLLVPVLALARPRLAIVPFDGDTNGTMQDVVVGLLEEDYSIVSPRRVTRAVDKLELDPVEMSARELKRLAKELDVDSIIRGDYTTRGSRKILHVLLFVDGKKVRGFKAEFVSAKSAKFKRALRDKLLDKLGGAKKRGDDETSVEEALATKGKKKRKSKKRRGGDDEDAEEVADDEDEDDDDDDDDGRRVASADVDDEDIDELGVSAGVSAGETGHTPNRAAVRVDLGGSFSARKLAFSSRAFEEAPNGYSNSPAGGTRVRAELYPLAFMNPDSIVAGIGFGGEYDQTIGLNARTTAQEGTDFPVTQKHWSVGARFRLVFGKKPTSPSVTLGGGYMNRVFKIDRRGLADGVVIDVPDVGYKGFNAGLDLRFPIVPAFAVVAGGRGIFVTTTGQIQTAAQYGQAKVTGGEGHLGFEVAFGSRIVLRAVGEVTQMGFDFVGTGQMSNNRDGDPTTQDVGGAADRYIGGAFTVGVAY